MTATPEDAGRTNRARGARPRRTREEMLARGCTDEGIALIAALDELLDACYPSRQKFLDAVAAENGGTEVMSVKTLSAQMGGGQRYAGGPTWKVARLIVERCAPEGCWVLELARVAGLWAAANGEPRPPGYYGLIFPTVTSANRVEHLNALTESLPHSTESRVIRPHSASRWLFRTLLLAAVLWASVWSLLDPGLRLGLSGAETVPSAVHTFGWSDALLLSTALTVTAAMLLRSRQHLALKPRNEVLSPPVPVGARAMIRHLLPLPAGMTPTRRGVIEHELSWSLPPNAVISTPLAVGRPWNALLHYLAMTRRISGCVVGELGVVVETTTDDVLHINPQGALEFGMKPVSEERPLVEWALVDDDGHLRATGLLPAPVQQGEAHRIVLPAQRRTVVEPLLSGDFSPYGLTDDDVTEMSWFELNFTDLTGTVRWPPWYQVNIVLRRLDDVPSTVTVKWSQAGLHLHRASPYW